MPEPRSPLARATGSVLREVITEASGSVNAFCREHQIDRRNLSRYYLEGTRDIQLGVLRTYLDLAGVDLPSFTLRVEERLRQYQRQSASGRGTLLTTPDTPDQMK